MAYIGRPLQGANLAVQSGTGDGSDTTPIATLNYATTTNGSAVYLDGVRQLAGTDYNVTSQTTLTFTTAPANGVGIDVYFLGLELSIPTPADATVAKAKITSTLIHEHIDTTISASDSILFADATDSNANKKDTVQGILDLASGGAWAVKASGTFSSTSELVVTSVTKTIKAYLSFVPSADTSINMLTSTDGGSGWGGVPYYDVVMILGGSSTNTNDKTNNSGLFQLNAGMTQTNISASGNNVIVELTLHNPESNRAKIATWDICYPTTVAQDDNLIYTGIGKGTWNSTTAINAIKFYPGSGTFSAGTYTILELN